MSVKLNNREDLNETAFNKCNEVLETLKGKTDDEEWLTKETEKWAKDQAVYNGIVQSISILEGKDKKASKDVIPEILTEALAVSLDKSIGHNYLEDGENRWEFYHQKETKIPFKKILIAVGYAHSPGIFRFFAVTPDLMIPIIFLTQFWIFAGLIISTKQILNLKSNIKSFGIVFLSFLIIAFLSITFVMSRMNALPISNIS